MNESWVSADGQTTRCRSLLRHRHGEPQDFARAPFRFPESQLDRFLLRLGIGYIRPCRSRCGSSSKATLTRRGTSRPSSGPRQARHPAAPGRSRDDRDPRSPQLYPRIGAGYRNAPSSPSGNLDARHGCSPGGLQVRALVRGTHGCIPDDIHDLAVPVSHTASVCPRTPTGFVPSRRRGRTPSATSSPAFRWSESTCPQEGSPRMSMVSLSLSNPALSRGPESKADDAPKSEVRPRWAQPSATSPPRTPPLWRALDKGALAPSQVPGALKAEVHEGSSSSASLPGVGLPPSTPAITSSICCSRHAPSHPSS